MQLLGKWENACVAVSIQAVGDSGAELTVGCTFNKFNASLKVEV